MAETIDRWVADRGRRILCRVYRPRTERPLPVLVYFHGGCWVWSSIDTQRPARTRIRRGPARSPVVSVDYALSPEAKFPQAPGGVRRRHPPCRGAWRGVGARSDGAVRWRGLRRRQPGTGVRAAPARHGAGPAPRGILAARSGVRQRPDDTASYREFATGSGLTQERMSFYWDVYVPHSADRHHPLAAPLRADLTGLPPVPLQLAELDVLRSGGRGTGRQAASGGGAGGAGDRPWRAVWLHEGLWRRWERRGRRWICPGRGCTVRVDSAQAAGNSIRT